MSDLKKDLKTNAQPPSGSRQVAESNDEIVVRGTHFELYGAKELAMSMLGEAARVLADDPDLRTAEGALTEKWVREGKTGALSFHTCLEIAGIDEVDGVSMVEAIRETILGNPRKVADAVKYVTKAIRQAQIRDGGDYADEPMESIGDVQEWVPNATEPASLMMMYSPSTNSIDLSLGAEAEVQRSYVGMRGARG